MHSIFTAQDLILKLTSRKLWAAVAEFVSMLIVAFGAPQETAVQVSALVMAGAAVIAYIIGEGLADAAGAGAPVIQLPDLSGFEDTDPETEN